MLTEQYRPKLLRDVVGQDHITHRLERYVKAGDLPHMMLIGSHGTGKTTTAVAFCRELFGSSWQMNFLELNASDERGIDVIRGKVKSFAGLTSIGDNQVKIVFLDEADNLTRDAQAALRRTMELFSGNTRFILTCNYPNKIIGPIMDRCAIFRFRPIKDVYIEAYLRDVSQKEGIEIDAKALNHIAWCSYGSMRRSLNILEQLKVLKKEITIDDVKEVLPTLDYGDARELLRSAIKGNRKEYEDMLFDYYFNRGITVMEILDRMYRAVVDSDKLKESAKLKLITMLGDCDYYVTQGANELLQVRCFLARVAVMVAEGYERRK